MEKLGNREINWEKGKVRDGEVGEFARPRYEEFRSRKRLSRGRKTKWQRGKLGGREVRDREIARCHHERLRSEHRQHGRLSSEKESSHRERWEVRQKQETERFGRRREKSSFHHREEIHQKQETERFGRRREKSRFDHREEGGEVRQKQETEIFGRRREKSRFDHREERGELLQKPETERFGRRWEKSRFHHREERGEVRQKQETERFGRRWEKSRFHRGEIAHQKKRKRERSQPSRWEEEEADSLRSSGSREKSQKVIERSTPSSLGVAGDDGESGSDSGFSGESDPFGLAKFIKPNYKPPENWHTYFDEPTPISVRLWSPGHHHRPTRSYTRRERGIDYKHWSIFINPSVISTYQGRKEKVLFFLKMLAQLLGSNDKALKCLYAVRGSGFSCRLPGKVALRFYSFEAGVVWSVGIEKYIFREGQFQKGKYCEDWERFPLHGVDKLSYYRRELDREIALDNK